MPIQDTILSTPVNVTAFADTAPLAGKLDGAFSNLVNYARKNWSYTASSRNGGEDLLAGTATEAPCGGIATALKRVFIDGLGVDEDDIEYIRVTGYLWTKPEYLCFDSKVKGNIRWLNQAGYGHGCIFNEHYYLMAEHKYYDPCLSRSYSIRDECIREKFDTKVSFGLGSSGNRKFMATRDRSTGILYMPRDTVAGFNGAYVMFDLTKKNIEKALGKTDYGTEMNYRGGDTGFARFVSALD